MMNIYEDNFYPIKNILTAEDPISLLIDQHKKIYNKNIILDENIIPLDNVDILMMILVPSYDEIYVKMGKYIVDGKVQLVDKLKITNIHPSLMDLYMIISVQKNRTIKINSSLIIKFILKNDVNNLAIIIEYYTMYNTKINNNTLYKVTLSISLLGDISKLELWRDFISIVGLTYYNRCLELLLHDSLINDRCLDFIIEWNNKLSCSYRHC